MNVQALVLPIFVTFLLQISADAFLLTAVTPIEKVVNWATTWSDFVKTGDAPFPEIAEKYVEVPKATSTQSCKLRPQPIDTFVSEVGPVLFVLSNQLADIEAQHHNRIDDFHNVTGPFELDIEEHPSMTSLDELTDSFSQTFHNLLTNLHIAEESDTGALCREACDSISHQLLQKKVNKLRDSLDPKSRLKTVVEIIVQNLKVEPKELCGAGQSTYDYLHSIYASVILAEVRAYAIQVFYLNLLYKYKGNEDNCVFTTDNSDIQVKILQDGLNEHLTHYASIFADAMQQVSRDHRACDEGRLDEEETFLKLTGAVQTMIQFLELPAAKPSHYEIDDHNNLCEYFNPDPTPYACLQVDLPWCLTDRRRPCFGDILTCNAIRDVKVCLTEDDSRRFQWVKSHMTYKNSTGLTCAGKQVEIKDHICLCLCHDYGTDSISTHLFNLQPVESDTARNKIVTGVKFIVKNNVMTFQIQQGTLGAHWNVSDVDWKEVKDISEKIRFARLGSKLRGESPNVIEYRDFLIVDTLIGTGINLDRLTVPHGYVLTGVKFAARRPPQDAPKRIHIGLVVTKFNYETGQLFKENRIIVKYTQHADELIYNTQDVNSAVTPLLRTSMSEQFVYIKPSDWRSADSGQTTLPYFDAKSVTTKPPSPIGGMEIFHKTKGTFTGMLSLVLISLDYANYMNESM